MDPPEYTNSTRGRDDSLVDAARMDILGESTDTSSPTLRNAFDSDQTARGADPDSGAVVLEQSSPVTLYPEYIAHYHIKRRIEEGGMGYVFEATQERPRRTVAIKVMKHGVTSPRALRRFQDESQILAQLSHPGIAHVYDAGWYDAGKARVPYFAMEYIPNATSLLQYASRQQLAMPRRLELFVSVCLAVHHGHQRGIIHRDLKPSNILIDVDGNVKIIDFGVARCTDADMKATTLQTSVGEMVGTLSYMSPEQCRADPNDLDIRSDVYSLGVVLYELLSGRLPYDLSNTPIVSIPHVICAEPPTQLRKINRALPGDVETIVHTAIEKERQRRYQSALELASDIQRFLRHEPIDAHPPSAVYRLGKLLRRRRTPFAIAAVMVFLAGVGLALAAKQAQAHRVSLDLRRERDRLSSEVTLLEAGAPWFDFDKLPIGLEDMLKACDRAIEIDVEHAKAYAVRARIHYRQRRFDRAGEDCQTALKIEPGNALALRTCAAVAHEKRNFARARQLFEQALDDYAYQTDIPRDFHYRARLRRIDGQYELALRDHDRAVAMATDKFHKNFGLLYPSRGVTRRMNGDTDGAIEDFTRAASLRPGRAAQMYLWIWEVLMLRDNPGDREQATAAFAQAEYAAQDEPDAMRILTILRDRKQYDLHVSVIKDPLDRAQVFYYLGVQALIDDRKDEAKTFLQQAGVPALQGYNEFDLAKWHLRQLMAD